MKKGEIYTQEEEEKEMVKPLGAGGFILEIIKIIALAFLIIVPVRVFLFQPFFVQGASMEPNFQDSQYLIVNELGFKKTTVGSESVHFFTVKAFRDIKRQAVIVFRYPIDPRKYFIKRVIGLPGEKVEIKNSKVFIYNQENPDGFELDENIYLGSSVKTAGDTTITLSEDEYFVMGDNRPFSSDSRAWGPIKSSHIMGEVLVRAWPLDKLSIF
jgi:signal peptidase I